MTSRQFASPDPEPGDDVQRVVDPDGDVWKRTTKGWVAHRFGGEPTGWDDLLDGFGRLVDVTDEPDADTPPAGPPS